MAKMWVLEIEYPARYFEEYDGDVVRAAAKPRESSGMLVGGGKRARRDMRAASARGET